MPIYQLPSLTIKLERAEPEYPAHVELHAELSPPELFGEGDLTGRLSLLPSGAKLQMTHDPLHGGIISIPDGRLSPSEIDAPFFNLEFCLRGRVATVHGTLDSRGALLQVAHLCAFSLPGFLSNALIEPVGVDRLFGDIGGNPFRVEVVGTFFRRMSTDDRNQQIKRYFEVLSKVKVDSKDRIFAAQRYLNQALWLGYVARNPQQFAGERILNLHKAIEVLYPHSGSIDNLRVSLAERGLNKELVELFASLAILRNSVDVGHVKLGQMTAVEFKSFHEFLLHVTPLTGWLIEHTIKVGALEDPEPTARPESKAASPKALPGEPSALSKIMSMVDTWIQAVDLFRPDTFLAADSRSLVEEYRAKRERSQKKQGKPKKKG